MLFRSEYRFMPILYHFARHICRVTCRRGETPHLLGSSAWHRTPRRRTVPVRHADAARRRISVSYHLLQYVTGRAAANGIMKLRRFAKRLRYRCGMSFALLNRPHPTRRGGLSHGGGASSSATPTRRDAASPLMGTIVKGQSRAISPVFSRAVVVRQFIVAFLPMSLRLKKASSVFLLSAIRSLRRACTV